MTGASQTFPLTSSALLPLLSKWIASKAHYHHSQAPVNFQSAASSSPSLRDGVSPSKRARFVKEGIDESTETNRKGMYM